jgi:hypothetical protein
MHVHTLKFWVAHLGLVNPIYIDNFAKVFYIYKDVIRDIHFDIGHEFIAHFDPILSRHVQAWLFGLIFPTLTTKSFDLH